MKELTGEKYKAWQLNMACRACDNSDLMLVEPCEISRGYYPIPRQETWECTSCLTRHVDTINIKSRVSRTLLKFMEKTKR